MTGYTTRPLPDEALDAFERENLPLPPTPEEIQEQFTNAVKGRDYDAISAALELGADIDTEITESRYNGYSRHGGSSYSSYTFKTALFYALEKQDQTLVAFLIAHGADVNRENSKKTSTLTMATHYGSKACAKEIVASPLFERGASSHKAALQVAEEAKHKGPAQKELYQYINSVLSDMWQLVDDETVSRVSFDKDGMLEVTDQFNFKAGERIRHIRDFEFNTIQTSSAFFVDMPANMRSQLKEAWDALKAAGGGKNADPQAMNAVRVHQVPRRIEKARQPVK